MSAEAPKLLERLLRGEHLDEATAGDLLRLLARGEIQPALAGALLAALRAKGETPEEIRGFARAMRELALRPAIPAGAYVDIVGTGGDGSGSLNLSTGASLLAAACGLPVVKHGNRSVSSKSGSADVLAALGLPIPLDEAAAGACLARCGFTFLFAPHYHPATKNIAAVRQALGVRTVFNILGPLANPAAPPFHVIGAFSDAMAASMADTLSGLPLTRAFVVHGEAGWDEATPAGPFICYDVRFPELFRAAVWAGQPELFVVIANFPAKRIAHWIRLLQARAIENQAWVMGVNRIGQDPFYSYNGRSIIVDPQGEIGGDRG